MEKVRVTIDLPVERLSELQNFLEEKEVGVIPVTTKGMATQKINPDDCPSAPIIDEPMAVDEPAPKTTVTKTMLRAKGVELAKAGKQADLEAALGEFGAKKLSEVKEEDYEKLYELLGGK